MIGDEGMIKKFISIMLLVCISLGICNTHEYCYAAGLMLPRNAVSEDEYLQLLRQQPYNRVTFLGTHNASTTTSENSLSKLPYSKPNCNQHLSLLEQLDVGVRFFDIDFQKVFDEIYLVHGDFTLGYTRATDAFNTFRDWVQNHPDEVITLSMSDKHGFSDFNTDILNLYNSTDLGSYVYSYNMDRQVNDPWPTLQEMIDVGKTVMVIGMDGQSGIFTEHQNFFQYTGNDPVNGWKAKRHEDLGPDKLYIDPQYTESTRLFSMNTPVSRRDFFKDMPYLTAGNPIQSRHANIFEHTYNLAKECEERLKLNNQCINYVTVDYLLPEEGIIDTVKQLNMERMGLIPPFEFDVAVNCSAWSDSEESIAGNYIYQGNDGDYRTRYTAKDNNTGHWWHVDLGRVLPITGTQIIWEFDGKKYGYEIQISDDGETWTTVIDKNDNPSRDQFQEDRFNASARYVRINSTYLEYGYFSFFDFKVLGYRGELSNDIVSQINVAPLATVTSSSDYNSNYACSKVVDGVIRLNHTGEWTSNGELNPWIQLDWDSSKTINKIVLYDRVNSYDWSENGTLIFSDGSSINVTGIPNDGMPRSITFPDKTVTWIKFQVAGTKAENNGLSEIQVYEVH